jgi:mRNA interferase MazF
VTLSRGTVVLVELDPTVGHEQRGVRPCVAISDPAINADLTKQSCALIDHLRSIDKRRIRRVFGRIAADELHAVDQGLALFLGLPTASSPDMTS